MSDLIQNGTTTAHGRTWPLYERRMFVVKTVGHIDLSNHFISERGLKHSLETSLQELLEPYGVKLTLEPVMKLNMSPEYQAEKEAQDEAAIAQ